MKVKIVIKEDGNSKEINFNVENWDSFKFITEKEAHIAFLGKNSELYLDTTDPAEIESLNISLFK